MLKIEPKIFVVLWLIVPGLLILTGTGWILIQKNLILFPHTDFSLTPYTDENDQLIKGRSKVEEFRIFSNQLMMSYTLKPSQFDYPYAGITIRPKKNFFNIKGYDYFNIKIHSQKSERLRLYILLYNKDITVFSDYLSYVYLYKELPVWQNKEEYNIDLKDFYIPDWWHDITNISANDKRLKKDFTKTLSIQIQSGNLFPLNVTDTIEITEIYFSKDKLKQVWLVIIILLEYFAFLSIYLLWTGYKSKLLRKMYKGFIPYTPLQVKNWDAQDEDARKIVEYLKNHYQNPELSVKDISAACAIPVYRISPILKEEFQLSFSGYLNFLRINEAKRLLKKTNSSITQIVMKVGYNNISYFNKQFRFHENISPREFRKKNNEK